MTLPQKIVTRGNVAAGQSAVRLSELGPRLTLHLIKIEDGLLNGEVLFHDIIQKTDEEKAEISKRRSQKKYVSLILIKYLNYSNILIINQEILKVSEIIQGNLNN